MSGWEEEEGSITIFCRKFLFHNAENFCRGTLLCCVSEKFRQRKSIWIGGGEYQEFPLNIFCLTVPKNAVGEHFTHLLISGIENVWMRWWGVCQDFPFKNSCLTVPKNALGEPFSHSLVSGIEKVWIRGSGEEEGSVTNFCRKLFISQCRKFL